MNQLRKGIGQKYRDWFDCWLSVNTALSLSLIYSFSRSANFAVFWSPNPNFATLIEQRSLENAPLSSEISEIVIIDAAIKEPTTLIGSLPPQTRVYYLDSAKDGVKQITQILSSHQNLQAIHILAHGSAGQMNLGAGMLDSITLRAKANQLATWGKALSINGDILLYGCDFAQGSYGQASVDTLAQLTQADVAASINATGSKALGGDWDLEVSRGIIESHPTQNYFARSNYSHILVDNPNLPSNFCNLQVDLMFVLDESGSVSTQEREQQRDSVRDTLQYLVDNNINARAAIVSYATNGRQLTSNYVDVNSTTIGTNGALEQAIQNYGVYNENNTTFFTNWEVGLDTAQLVANSNGYPDALFFFTDGTINNGGSPDDEADSFKTNGTHIYTIGIGGDVNVDDLERLTDGANRTIYNPNDPNPVPADHVDVTDYGSLSSDFLDVFQDACSKKASLTKEFTPDTIFPTEVSTLGITKNKHFQVNKIVD